jgi:hypothetical protein
MNCLRAKERFSDGITVRSRRIPIGIDCMVECNDEEAAILLAGGMFTKIENQKVVKNDQPLPVKTMDGQRQLGVQSPSEQQAYPILSLLDKDRLVAHAESLGLKVDRRQSTLKIIAAIRAREDEEHNGTSTV